MTGLAVEYVASIPSGNATLMVTMLSIFVGSVVAGLAGFAFSAISGGLLFHWLTPIEAVPWLLACSITAQVLSVATLWRTMRWRQCLPYMTGGFVGIPVGTKLLAGVSPHAFAVWFGGFLVCYSVYMMLRPHFAIRRGGRIAEIVAGFAGGITGGATAFPGAIPTIWCSARPVENRAARDHSAVHIADADCNAGLFFQARHLRVVNVDGLFLVRSSGDRRHVAGIAAF
jgi:uncharacterized membrane protein YfcA